MTQRMKTGHIQFGHPSIEEYKHDQENIALLTWHIQKLEDKYLENRTDSLVNQLQFWYKELNMLQNKVYF
jgi:hypothetical protein